MKTMYIAAAVSVAALATPAFAQDDNGDRWTGGYAGISLGDNISDGGDGETLVFDTNRDGTFDNSVTTAAGANAFSPGFCGGSTFANTPTNGCDDDDRGLAISGFAGYDRQVGPLVLGAVVELGSSEVGDSVTGFSTTPASYTFTREIDLQANFRARAGLALNNTLIYGTGGLAYAQVDNSFTTTNGFNTFTEVQQDEAEWGYTVGGGVEQRLGDSLSLGVLYRYTDLGSTDYTVNAGNGTPPSTTNPFVNPTTTAGSTDIRRSGDFDYHSIAATLSFRF